MAEGAFAAAGPSTVTLQTPDGRASEVSVFPATGPKRGTILFSHGALSSPDQYLHIFGPWTDAGFEIYAPLHVDSIKHPQRDKYPMTASWATRLHDMQALRDHVKADKFISAGHSYGGLVATVLGGATPILPAGVIRPTSDPRVTCVVAFSPPAATPTLIAAKGYGTITAPLLLQTGDNDIPKGARWQVHLDAYEAAHISPAYGLVLPGVNHYFGGLICKDDEPGPPETVQLAQAVRISTAFMRKYALGDGAAFDAFAAALTPDYKMLHH
jgi:pimeloyl-ACP methyl ester carboxylesterase